MQRRLDRLVGRMQAQRVARRGERLEFALPPARHSIDRARVGILALVACEGFVDRAHRLDLQPGHTGIVNPLGVTQPCALGFGCELPAQRGHHRRVGEHVDALGVDIERVQEQAAHRRIRTRLFRAVERKCMQRIQTDHASAQHRGRIRQREQVGEVADAPVAQGPHAVELHRDAPLPATLAQRLRQVATRWCAQQHGGHGRRRLAWRTVGKHGCAIDPQGQPVPAGRQRRQRQQRVRPARYAGAAQALLRLRHHHPVDTDGGRRPPVVRKRTQPGQRQPDRTCCTCFEHQRWRNQAPFARQPARLDRLRERGHVGCAAMTEGLERGDQRRLGRVAPVAPDVVVAGRDAGRACGVAQLHSGPRGQRRVERSGMDGGRGVGQAGSSRRLRALPRWPKPRHCSPPPRTADISGRRPARARRDFDRSTRRCSTLGRSGFPPELLTLRLSPCHLPYPRRRCPSSTRCPGC